MMREAHGANTHGTEWAIDKFDLDAYLRRIGIVDLAHPSVEQLRTLHDAHVSAIPFENLDVLLGRPPSLELDDLMDKLVHQRRGGYCYEQNLVLGAALERLGYNVTRLAGRIRMGSVKVRPRTHMLLRVQIPDQPSDNAWIADAGLGFIRPLEPIRLEDGAHEEQSGWHYAMHAEGDGSWALRILEEGEWRDAYSFTLEPQHLSDYRMANHFSATYPESPFVAGLFITHTTRQHRIILRNWQLTEHTPAGVVSHEVQPAELGDVLTDRFGLQLPSRDVSELLRRLKGNS